jgi:hypothetical protein
MSEQIEEVFDNIEELERKDTAKKLPWGWLILFIGLILWGIYYIIAYTPGISGWSQVGELQETMSTKAK